MALYDDSLTLRQARRQYFDANGFGEGGYDEKWVTLKIGPFPFAFPNTPQRVRSVRLHDLHHVVTDYKTDWTGEAEIGAWEIASNCRDHYAAWLLNLFAFGVGVLIAPAAVWRAFARGRQSGNLYESEFEETILEQRVGDLRRRLRLAGGQARASIADRVLFALWASAGVASDLAAAAILLSPLLLVAWLLR